MATTRLRDRIFAGFGAVLFLISATAFTGFVIYDMVTQKNTNTSDATAQTAQAKQCVAGATTDVLPVPDVYKPEGGTVSTLEKTDISTGTGKTAKKGDCLVMKYYGTLAADGTMFDENFTKSSAFAFTLGSGQVIKGWDEGLLGIKEGGVRRLVIPADLAYGPQGQGAIPANAALVFVVKLIKIQ
jgi:FKBP-type peptidyl-prolyl cis-trans isomerase